MASPAASHRASSDLPVPPLANMATARLIGEQWFGEPAGRVVVEPVRLDPVDERGRWFPFAGFSGGVVVGGVGDGEELFIGEGPPRGVPFVMARSASRAGDQPGLTARPSRATHMATEPSPRRLAPGAVPYRLVGLGEFVVTRVAGRGPQPRRVEQQSALVGLLALDRVARTRRRARRPCPTQCRGQARQVRCR